MGASDRQESGPGFAWVAIGYGSGAGLASRVGDAGGVLVTLTPGRGADGRSPGYALRVGRGAETVLLGCDLAGARRQAEALVRRRYPEHFRGVEATRAV